jgi:arylsulfatase A-like enzyme
MNRRRLWLLLPLLLVWGCGPGDEPASEAPAQPPPKRSLPLNFVIITLDTVRADALSAYGQKLPSSPRIDALAAEGLLFEQALASAPSTLPSHASLFTGKHPYAHGVRSNFGYSLAEENVTLAEVLGSRGYRTAAEVAAPVLSRQRMLAQGFATYRDPGDTETILERLEAQEEGRKRLLRSAEEITRAGLDFLRQNADRPFLLWLHYFDAHRPYQPPAEFQQQIPESPYHAEVARLDHSVGLIADEIERLGMRERTLVVVTSDHGEGRGDHGEESHSFFVYDSTIHVPLIFWGADAVPRGQRVSGLVRLVDVAPTLLDLVGAPLPAGMQGVSLRPLLQNPGLDLALTGYGESIEPASNFGASTLRFIRLGRWKYIHKLEPELYDVVADPAEVDNLADRHPERLAELRARLTELIDASPAKPAGSEVKLDTETLNQLHALGYVGGATPVEFTDEASMLEVRGPDPTTRIDDVWDMSVAFGYLLNDQLDEAEAIFRKVHERNPNSLYPLQSLIETLYPQERHDEVAPLLRRLIELDPENPLPRSDLAKVLRKLGELEEAEALFRQTLVLDECVEGARLHLSDLLHSRKRYREQVAVLAAGIDDCAKSVTIRNALAYALATSPDGEVRDGERALLLAQAAVDETDGKHPDYLDSLACAYAELGRFEPAVANQELAIALLEEHDILPEAMETYRDHLASFRAGEPAREP